MKALNGWAKALDPRVAKQDAPEWTFLFGLFVVGVVALYMAWTAFSGNDFTALTDDERSYVEEVRRNDVALAAAPPVTTAPAAPAAPAGQPLVVPGDDQADLDPDAPPASSAPAEYQQAVDIGAAAGLAHFTGEWRGIPVSQEAVRTERQPLAPAALTRLVQETTLEPGFVVVQVIVDVDGRGPQQILEARSVTVQYLGGEWLVTGVSDV